MDLGVPRNIDPSLADLYNVYLYNLDDLTEIVRQNRAAREQEFPGARNRGRARNENSCPGRQALRLLGLLEVFAYPRSQPEGGRRQPNSPGADGTLAHFRLKNVKKWNCSWMKLLENY